MSILKYEEEFNKDCRLQLGIIVRNISEFFRLHRKYIERNLSRNFNNPEDLKIYLEYYIDIYKFCKSWNPKLNS